MDLKLGLVYKQLLINFRERLYQHFYGVFCEIFSYCDVSLVIFVNPELSIIKVCCLFQLLQELILITQALYLHQQILR